VFAGAAAPTERISFLSPSCVPRSPASTGPSTRRRPRSPVQRTAPEPLAPNPRDVHKNLPLVNEQVAPRSVSTIFLPLTLVTGSSGRTLAGWSTTSPDRRRSCSMGWAPWSCL